MKSLNRQRALCLAIVLFAVGCGKTEPPGLSQLKRSLSGVDSTLKSQHVEVTSKLTEQTDLLRQIRDRIVTPVPTPDPAFTDVEGQAVESTDLIEKRVWDPSNDASPQKTVDVADPADPAFADAETDPVATAERDAQLPPSAVSPDYDDVYIIKWTASWCGPCVRWDRGELPKLKDAGVTVTEIDVDLNKKLAKWQGITSVPRFQVYRKSTRKRLSTTTFVGYTAAEKLINHIDEALIEPAARPAMSSPPLLTKPVRKRRLLKNLREWVRRNYAGVKFLQYDVSPRSDVWNHLCDGDRHGFTMDQVRGLSQWDALCLHDAEHRGLIGAFL